MTPRAEAKPIPMGGRLFRAARLITAERDDWIAGRIAHSQVKKVGRLPGESEQDYGERLLEAFRASGYVSELIGGVLTPIEIEDLDWTPAVAMETAKFVGQLYEPTDKAQRDVVLLTVLIDFFANGLISSSGTASSSPTPDESQPEVETK